MPFVDGREYRDIRMDNFKAIEDPLEEDPLEEEPKEEELQEDEEKARTYIVEGYATTFDDPYDFGRGELKECITRHALDNADLSDVIFQYDHEGRVLARQRNNTLAVMCDDHGLWVKADLSGSESGRNLYEEIKNGLVDRMSWAFTVAEDGWEYDPNTRTSYITKVDKVYDVSAVSIPANEGTEINARSYIDGVIDMAQQELLRAQEEKAMRARLALRMMI